MLDLLHCLLTKILEERSVSVQLKESTIVLLHKAGN